ncbi:MAG: exosortase/archaeosortase family protein [Fimbriimonadales bacterium]|nr:exosortase/archaeosortase family protein [Fimbriimonadales bacterium]
MAKTELPEEAPQQSDEQPSERPAEETVQIPLIGVELPKVAVPWIFGGILAALILGWSFLSGLPSVWFDDEGYYSHGVLVPFLTLYILYARRDKIREQSIGVSMGGMVVLILGLLIVVAAKRIDNLSLASGGFILSLIGAVYFCFGKRVGKLCVGPLLFLVFMMPVLGFLIDNTTNPLQLLSTKVASAILSIFGYNPHIPPAYQTLIHLDSYELNVGGPCSGFKLILSLTAFTTFFIMISNLGLFKNLLLLLVINPVLALFINGLRIMLIGVVGQGAVNNPDAWWAQFLHKYGEDAGMVFHDWSGYITLIVCFVILHFIVQALERRKPDVAQN